MGAAVDVAVLEGVGALVKAQDCNKTDTASANARGFHCANVAPSREYLRSVKLTASYRSLRTMWHATHIRRALRVIETDR